MKDKYVLVTGSSSGIGKAITAKLLDLGAKVVGISRDHKKSIIQHDNYISYTLDISDIHNLEKNIRISPFVFPSDLITGGIAMIIQSGSVLGALTNNDRRLRYNFFVSSGSENVTNASDYLLWALNQPSTSVVGMVLESVRDPGLFIEGLKLAKEKSEKRRPLFSERTRDTFAS